MINDEDHPTMQVQVDESAGPEHGLEPIMSALIAVSSPVTELWDPPEVSETLPDERTYRLMGRLAKRCADHVHTLRRRAYRLGHDVNRAVRIWSHDDGLAALARRMKDDHSTGLTPQTLGNARTIYQKYTLDEYENRFSDLRDTHLLKAQQMLGSNREERDKVLDQAQDVGMSVARMQEEIKKQERRCAKAIRAAKRATLEPPATGLSYKQNDADLRRLRDNSVAFMRIRGTVLKDLMEAARAVTTTGIIVQECPSIAEFADIAGQAKKHGLRTVHPLVITSSTIGRNVVGLPIVDRYHLTILMSPSWRLDKVSSQKMDNPMTTAQSEALIYDLIPDDGVLVDIGPGSLSTAAFALKHQREYLAIEKVAPDQAGPCAPDQEAPQSESSDYWSAVSEQVRKSVTIAGVQWPDLNCCDKTIVARLVSGVEQLACPACTEQGTMEQANHE